MLDASTLFDALSQIVRVYKVDLPLFLFFHTHTHTHTHTKKKKIRKESRSQRKRVIASLSLERAYVEMTQLIQPNKAVSLRGCTFQLLVHPLNSRRGVAARSFQSVSFLFFSSSSRSLFFLLFFPFLYTEQRKKPRMKTERMKNVITHSITAPS